MPVYAGFDDKSLADTPGAFAFADLGFKIRIGDTNYDSLYVHMNGIVTFATPGAPRTPRPLPLGTVGPVIAPFWADVDVRMQDNVTFGQGSFMGKDAFGVTWREVSPYVGGSPERPKNTFQLLIVDRSENAEAEAFELFFFFEKIEFDQGSAMRRRGRKKGVFARSGADFGEFGFFEILGSGQEGIFLDKSDRSLASDESLAQSIFQVQNGMGGRNVLPPLAPIPLPATAPLLLGGLVAFGLVGRGMRRRREQSPQ